MTRLAERAVAAAGAARRRVPRLGPLAPRAVLGALLGRQAGAADRAVPPGGAVASLVTLTSAAMAFLAVFAIALALATGRLAERWSEGLARGMTVRIEAGGAEGEATARTALEVLRATPGIAEARLIPDAEMQALLTPWFGPDMPLEALPIPRLIEVTTDGRGPDGEGLALRLKAEAPGAVLDDHTRWRRPLVAAAQGIRWLGWLSLGLIAATAAAIVALAARATLAANTQTIAVLRLIGARDVTIADAFMRRLTRRAFLGAGIGTLAGLALTALLPGGEGSFLTGLGFAGWSWAWLVLVPLAAAAIAWTATRRAALAALRRAA